MLLLNNVKRYLPDASIVVGIITPNGHKYIVMEIYLKQIYKSKWKYDL